MNLVDGLKQQRNYLSFLAGAGFLVLFPGFFFYHLGVAGKLMPPFVAGLFGPATLSLCFLFSLFSLSILQKIPKSAKPLLYLFISFVVFVFIWTCLHFTFNLGYDFGPNEGKRIEAFVQVVTTLVSWVALFVIGIFLPVSDKKFKICIKSLFLLMLLAAMVLCDSKSLMMNVNYLHKTAEDVATYQGFARSVVVLAMVLVFSSDKYSNQIFTSLLCIILLFVVGARSELYGFVFALLVFISYKCLKSFYGIILTSIIIILCFYMFLEYGHDLNSSRQLQVFNLEKSTSWQSRKALQNLALSQIIENPISGVYAGHFYAGGAGSYSHNILSAWVSFGFFGFIFYVALLLYGIILAIPVIFKKITAPVWDLVFIVNVFSVFLVMVAKPVFWPIPALGWGLIINAKVRDNMEYLKNQTHDGEL